MPRLLASEVMDPLWTALANLGAPAIMAGMLFVLHREAIKAFRDEMSKEREYHSTQHDQIISRLDKHSETLASFRCRATEDD